MEFKKQRIKNVQLDITPIVDTVFILLIFFALSLNFAPSSLLNINLPEVPSKNIISETKQVKIQITKTGECFLNETRIDIDTLQELLRKIFLIDKKSNVVIEADYSITHGTVVRIMSICKKAGYKRISIATCFQNH